MKTVTEFVTLCNVQSFEIAVLPLEVLQIKNNV